MASFTAGDVKALRERTGLPLMDCKRALTEAEGDADLAVQKLRERGAQVAQDKFADRETAFGRFGIYTSVEPGVGALVEFKCESAPVTKNEEFVQLASDLAQQLATGPGAKTAEELLAQPCPSKSGSTLGEVKDDLFNRIREKFEVGRMVRIDGACAAYEHPGAIVHGVLLEATGAKQEAAGAMRDICMHIAAMKPSSLTVDDLDADVVASEKSILREAALKEGKPENIVDKMVDGRMKNFYAERVLLEQPFVKDDKLSVGQFAKENGFQVKQFIHWVLGQG